MAPNTPWDTIYRSIQSGESPVDEHLILWLNANPANGMLYNELRTIWQKTGSLPEPFTPNKAKAWRKVQKKAFEQSRPAKVRRIASYSRNVAAAILLVAVTIWATTLLQKPKTVGYAQVIAPMGQKTQVILPDGSTVWLNGGSTIKYPTSFNEEKREVFLKGEGFFQVTKNKKKQFVVHVSDLEVKVFGTSFNVKKYITDPEVEVGLQTGSVALEKEENPLVKLVPGEIAYYNKQKKTIRVAKTDMNIVSAWTNNELVFDNKPFSEVAKYMERWYGVNIDLDTSLSKNHSYTFRIKTESLREMLELINIMTPIRYEINGSHVKVTNRNTKKQPPMI
jgi:Fe2+-dicitrate sensor, membrane component